MRVSNNRRTRGGRANTGNNRTGSNAARTGGNSNRRSNSGNRNYDSNGPDGKIRGTATQVYDKYIALATDAQTAGDRVAAENYFQHAEHYFRIIAANNLAKQEKQMMEAQDSASDADEENIEAESQDSGETVVKSRKKAEQPRDEAVDPGHMEQPVVEFPDAGRAADAMESEAAADEGDEDSKPKRKVSRTRTLRRRTSSRAIREDSPEEVNSTE